MKQIKIFISSVQSEFAEERQMLFEYLTTDALLGKFFEPFVFDFLPVRAYISMSPLRKPFLPFFAIFSSYLPLLFGKKKQ